MRSQGSERAAKKMWPLNGCVSAGRECLPSLNETDMKPHKPSFVWAVVPVTFASLGKGTVLSRIFGQAVVAAGRYQQEGSD